MKCGRNHSWWHPNRCLPTPWMVLLWAWTIFPGAAWPAQEVVLVTPVNSIDTVISEVILRQAYQRLGLEPLIRKYPAERAMQLADEGRVDGEVQRIDGIDGKYPNLIQVYPAINYIEGTVFSRDTEFTVNGWASLEPYRIGIIRGIKFAERDTAGMDVQRAGDYERLFRMLENQRFEIVVSPGINGECHIRRLGIEGIDKLEPAIMRFELFHYLHRDNADLVPDFSAVLEEMRISGELERIRQHVIDVLLERASQGLGVCDQDYACFEQAVP